MCIWKERSDYEDDSSDGEVYCRLVNEVLTLEASESE